KNGTKQIRSQEVQKRPNKSEAKRCKSKRKQEDQVNPTKHKARGESKKKQEEDGHLRTRKPRDESEKKQEDGCKCSASLAPSNCIQTLLEDASGTLVMCCTGYVLQSVDP
ncbi:hypothetical protein KI387_012208, partial [Taxus chinensis]